MIKDFVDLALFAVAWAVVAVLGTALATLVAIVVFVPIVRLLNKLSN